MSSMFPRAPVSSWCSLLFLQSLIDSTFLPLTIYMRGCHHSISVMQISLSISETFLFLNPKLFCLPTLSNCKLKNVPGLLLQPNVVKSAYHVGTVPAVTEDQEGPPYCCSSSLSLSGWEVTQLVTYRELIQYNIKLYGHNVIQYSII